MVDLFYLPITTKTKQQQHTKRPATTTLKPTDQQDDENVTQCCVN